MEELLYRCWTKASNRESGSPRMSWNWVTSRRAWFKVYRDRIECGDWTVPSSSIQRAVLYRGRSLVAAARVLHVETETGSYQFGFNPWVEVESHLPFDFEQREVRLRYSLFSLLIRFGLVAYLSHLLWRRLAG